MGQYIGARYVPKFMGVYDPTQMYEALDVVDNGLGTSYIAKIPTPAGTPLTNTTYWAIYGATSGAIINLQNQIDDMKDGDVPGSLQNQIDDMKDGDVPGSLQEQINTNTSDITALTKYHNIKKILFIADSFNTYVPNAGWDRTFIAMAGLTTSDYVSIAVAGSGFTVNNNTWYEILTNRLPVIADKDLFSDVIVCSGGNDNTASLSDLTTAMENFKTLVNTNFPNAKVHVGYLGRHGLSTNHALFNNGRRNYKKACAKVGFEYLHNVEWVLFWKPYLIDNTAVNPYDYLHPTADGLEALGNAIYQAFMTGSADVEYSADVTATKSSNVSSLSSNTISVQLVNGVTQLLVSNTFMRFVNNVSADQNVVIGTYNSNLLNADSLQFTVPYFLPNTPGSASNAIITFTNGEIKFLPFEAIPANELVRFGINLINVLTTTI